MKVVVLYHRVNPRSYLFGLMWMLAFRRSKLVELYRNGHLPKGTLGVGPCMPFLIPNLLFSLMWTVLYFLYDRHLMPIPEAFVLS